jgi:hypothetical protein
MRWLVPSHVPVPVLAPEPILVPALWPCSLCCTLASHLRSPIYLQLRASLSPAAQNLLCAFPLPLPLPLLSP